MTPIKRKLLYFFRSGTSLLRLRISWNHGLRYEMSVGYHIDKTDVKGKPKWNGERCSPNSTHGKEKISASIINKALDKIEDRIDKAFLEFEMLDKVPTVQELKLELSSHDKKSKDFFEAYDEFLKEGVAIRFWSESTKKKLKAKKNLLLQFDKNLTFDAIDENKLNAFVKHQMKNCVAKNKPHKNYNNKSILKNIENLKWFLRWAKHKGYHNNYKYEDFSISLKTPTNPVIFLTWAELMEMYNKDYSKQPERERVKDAFCFCCFTSLRYSDLANLKKSNIHHNSITITIKKTADTVVIELNKYSKAIIEKYKDFEGEGIMPIISNQKMNDMLKKIAKDCNIDTPIHLTRYVGKDREEITVPKYQLISTHCGRRTFICNALSMGIAPNIVMKWTGHSDYKAMKPYIDIADEIKKQSMSLFDKQ